MHTTSFPEGSLMQTEYPEFSLPKDLARDRETMIRRLCSPKTWKELIAAYGEGSRLSGFTVVEAHGGTSRSGKSWRYRDGEKTKSVQALIRELDGKHLCIILVCCNSGNHSIHSHHSIVIHLSQRFSGLDLLRRKAKIRIFVPGEGYVESNYRQRRRLIEKFNAQSRARKT